MPARWCNEASSSEVVVGSRSLGLAQPTSAISWRRRLLSLGLVLGVVLLAEASGEAGALDASWNAMSIGGGEVSRAC